MRSIFGKTVLAVAAVLSLVGCAAPPRSESEADRVIQRIETGRHRPSVPPTSLINTRKKLYRLGEDIKVTVRVFPPVEGRVLDPYLPICGRFRVSVEGERGDIEPPASSARLAWVEIPVDIARERERSFTVTINRIFPMNRTVWYSIWWEGRDDLGHRLRSGKTSVRVMTRVPSEE